MRFFLLTYCFLFLQAISCSFGTIETKPEATKLSIQNNSTVQLLGVIWNGTNFGDIDPGEFSEMIVSPGGDHIYFNNKLYCTDTYVTVKKYEHYKFPLIDNTRVIDVKTNIPSYLGDILNVD